MKAYLISPTENEFSSQANQAVSASIDLICEMVSAALLHGGERYLFAVNWTDPGEEPGASAFHEDRAELHLKHIDSAEALRIAVRRSLDPEDRYSTTIRSATVCRCATFGYDGQALLCLRHEDAALRSPDPFLVHVEDYSSALVETDYFDGWMPPGGPVKAEFCSSAGLSDPPA